MSLFETVVVGSAVVRPTGCALSTLLLFSVRPLPTAAFHRSSFVNIFPRCSRIRTCSCVANTHVRHMNIRLSEVA